LRIHDHSHYVKEHTSKNAFGGIAQTGIYYFFAKRYFADFNFEYLYQHFYFSHHEDRPHVKRTNLDLSGIKIGAGLGIQF